MLIDRWELIIRLSRMTLTLYKLCERNRDEQDVWTIPASDILEVNVMQEVSLRKDSPVATPPRPPLCIQPRHTRTVTSTLLNTSSTRSQRFNMKLPRVAS